MVTRVVMQNKESTFPGLTKTLTDNMDHSRQTHSCILVWYVCVTACADLFFGMGVFIQIT